MGQRRNSDVDLCFDSMTDLITNLAGGLMLVVLLLVGLTREAPKAPDPQHVHDTDAPRDEKSPRVLYDRLDTLKRDIDSVNDSLVGAEQDLKRLEKAVDAMQTEAKAAPAPAGGPEKK